MSNTNEGMPWQEMLNFQDEEVQGGALLSKVVKRDGQIENYDALRIRDAIAKTIVAVRGQEDSTLAESLQEKVVQTLAEGILKNRHPNSIPAIEEIQDVVESVLMESKEKDLAKAYILYRAKHSMIRDTRKLVLDINNER